MNPRLWYWVDRTRRSPPQRGMPDPRLLAQAYVDQGFMLTYVRWDVQTGWLAAPSHKELAGLPAAKRAPFDASQRNVHGGWLLVPEALTYLGAPAAKSLIASARGRGMRTAFLYADVLGEAAALPDQEEANLRYAKALGEADLVLCSDPASADKLLNFLWCNARRTASMDLRCRVVPFPAGDRSYATFCSDVSEHLVNKGGQRSLTTPANRRLPAPNTKALPKPLLSLCISTYNRADWLQHSLFAALQVTAPLADAVEVLDVDNASTDHTAEVVRAHSGAPHLRYTRNELNVGMLGNLKITANAARGAYVWIIGDDDIAIPGAVERILWGITTLGDVPLIYLNYAYTQIDQPDRLADLEPIFAKATPISHEFRDEYADEVRYIAAKTENCFTAIYCCVFRRDHAVRAYSIDTSGEPFSTLNTCVPSAVHVLNELFHGPALWLGEPCVIVNMHVSWSQYAPQFVLERLPEVYDLMEAKGTDRKQVDAIRQRSVPNIVSFMNHVLKGDADSGARISLERLVRRYKHLGDFEAALAHVFSGRGGAGRFAEPAQEVFKKYCVNAFKD